MGPGEAQKASYLPAARLDKVNEASPCPFRDPAHARPIPNALVLSCAGHVVAEGHAGSAIEKAFDDRFDICGMRGDSLSGVPEARTAHINFHENLIPAPNQGGEGRVKTFGH